VASAFGLSRSTVQSRKERLSETIRAYMGEDVLQQVQRPPQWRTNLAAIRARQACRVQRQAAAA
jgi:hypothetical protein